jgi:hypothetical protein
MAKHLVQYRSFRKGWTEEEERHRSTPKIQFERTASSMTEAKLQGNQRGLPFEGNASSNAYCGQWRCDQDMTAKVVGSNSNCMRQWRPLTKPWEVVVVNGSVMQRT